MNKNTSNHFFLTKKTVGILVILVFVLSIIPLFIIARYDHPCADDFAYGILTADAWRLTGSVWQTLLAAFGRVYLSYIKWQGSFSAVFLMALQPSVFKEEFYCVVPFIMLVSYILSSLMFYKVVLRNYLNADRFSCRILSLPFIALSIQLIPSAVEGFYWYNGSVYYTFFYSLSLILYSVLLLYIKSDQRRRNIFYLTISALLGFFISGGNYTTGLITLIAIFFLIVLKAWQKDKKVFPILGIFSVIFAGFLLNALAPGNSVRQATVVGKAGAAVLYSFYYAFVKIHDWTTLPLVILILALIPLLYKIVKKTKFTYRYPIFVLLLSGCIFSAEFTPPLYALGNPGPDRLLNIIYFSYYLLIFINLIYFLGWVSFKRKSSRNHKINVSFDRPFQGIQKYSLTFFLVGMVLLCVSFLGYHDFNHLSSVSALKSLKNHEAADYDAQVKDRLMIYADDKIQDIQFKAFTQKPYLLFFSDLEDDTSSWKNDVAQKYYHKKSIRVMPNAGES